ncbi:TlpA family protein disulfide reductase [Sinomicrobium weinanense]|uniref:Redoxin domain-containing protein n=1 Tax=Sinomicrobium weinanense TaxID=2842200 RepID=A0A926Q3K6_9FLAO|nr:redoxin domain-containing protein [Sinomicrobium weinanense]MBC9797034.1 redoxin domain-containing protein [Sinomicrobium weinanense]MBU3122029.1 peroxiredoxin family protein [Sinomicrobium weinanense]
MKKTVFIFLIFLSWTYGEAQENHYPEIGKPVPDFTLKNMEDYTHTKIRSQDLKGKFVILCFWSRFCSGAIKNLSKMNTLYQQFKGKAEIICIGGEHEISPGSYMLPGQEPGMDKLKELYTQLKDLQGLEVPITFDPGLFQRFVPRTVPHILWIDDKGIVQAITSSNSINAENIQSFLEGKPFFFWDESYAARQERKQHTYDRQKPFLTDSNGGKDTNFLYRSLLASYTRDMHKVPSLPYSMQQVYRTHGYTPQGWLEGWATLQDFYKMAYLAYWWLTNEEKKEPRVKNHYNRVVLELKNDSLFTDYDYESRKNMYVYSLIVPPERATPQYLMKTMQQDLYRYFGYEAKVETRTLPYWRITAPENTQRKLKTKGGKYALLGNGFTRIGFRNVSMDKYLNALLYMIRATVPIPIINETGIEGYIDIKETEVLLSDFEAIKQLLKKQGFIIEKAEKAFEVIVISDKRS